MPGSTATPTSIRTLLDKPYEMLVALDKRGREVNAAPGEVIRLESVRKSYGDTEVYRDLSLTLMRGDRVALVGAGQMGFAAPQGDQATQAAHVGRHET